MCLAHYDLHAVVSLIGASSKQFFACLVRGFRVQVKGSGYFCLGFAQSSPQPYSARDLGFGVYVLRRSGRLFIIWPHEYYSLHVLYNTLLKKSQASAGTKRARMNDSS